jgi:hypothetical protein
MTDMQSDGQLGLERGEAIRVSKLFFKDSLYDRHFFSVADPGCLSRIPDPDFCPSRIPDPKTATKERGEKKLVVVPFYVATNFTKL